MRKLDEACPSHRSGECPWLAWSTCGGALPLPQLRARRRQRPPATSASMAASVGSIPAWMSPPATSCTSPRPAPWISATRRASRLRALRANGKTRCATLRVPSAGRGALVGQVGNDRAATPFALGADGTVTVVVSGRLYLGVNQDSYFSGDRQVRRAHRAHGGPENGGQHRATTTSSRSTKSWMRSCRIA